MRRVAHWALPIGTTAIVLAVGIFHATVRDGRYRFGEQNPLWAYVLFSGLLVIAAVSLGIPDEPCYIQHAFATATAAAFLGTSMVAFVSLIRPGILPRFVIIATPALTAPWFVACCGISRGARRRQRRRDRVLAVLSAEEAATLRDDAVSEFPRPELAFTLAAILDVEDLAKDTTQRLLIETAGDQDATLIVLSEEAQRIDSIVAQAAVLSSRDVDSQS